MMVIKKKRGRPLGWRKAKPIMPVVGTGEGSYDFPIVRDGHIKKPVTILTVHAKSFAEALHDAVAWALKYSQDQSETSPEVLFFWPVVMYNSPILPEKRIVTKVDGNFAFASSRESESWLNVLVLRTVK